VLEKGEVEAAALTFSLDVAPVEIRRAEDIVSAFLALKGRAEALYVCGDALIANNRSQIARDGCRRPTCRWTNSCISFNALGRPPGFPDWH
jgi:hypothetical protein